MIKEGWKLVDEATQQVSAQADGQYQMFRDEPVKLLAGYPPRHEGSSGKVDTTLGTFFPSVIGLKWVKA